ncbi:MAG: DUF2461 domain-containing protein [Melioribacteraceae bacterium]|nr:DUF2461 domain-containing protein [Melioribacteraceae bacterium]
MKGSFNGFNRILFSFFAELEKNNNLKWFNEKREHYHKFIVEPSKQFITSISPFLNRLNPSIRTEPKFNETIMRINKDLRFSKGDPYRNYWLIHFGRFKMDSEFFLYFDSKNSDIGLFINNTKGDNLFFKKNFELYKNDIKNIFLKNSLNNKYSLYSLDNKEPKEIKKKFDAEKDLFLFEKFKMFLLQKSVPKKIVFSNKIVFEMIKMITELYPVYCFCISPNPLKEIEKFQNEFGEIVE